MPGRRHFLVLGALALAAPTVAPGAGAHETALSGKVRIVVIGRQTTPGNDAGTFSISGVISDRGTETGTMIQQSGSLYVFRLVLKGKKGRLIIRSKETLGAPGATGTWTVISGTGTYRGTKGSGKVTASFTPGKPTARKTFTGSFKR